MGQKECGNINHLLCFHFPLTLFSPMLLQVAQSFPQLPPCLNLFPYPYLFLQKVLSNRSPALCSYLPNLKNLLDLPFYFLFYSCFCIFYPELLFKKPHHLTPRSGILFFPLPNMCGFTLL